MSSTSRRKAIFSTVSSALSLIAGCTGSFSQSTEPSQTTTQVTTPTSTPKPSPTVSPRLSDSFEQKNIVRGRKIIPLKTSSNFGGIRVSINQSIVTRKNTYEYSTGFGGRGSVDLKPGDYGPGKDYDFDNPKILFVEIIARSNDVVDVPDPSGDTSGIDLVDNLYLYFDDIKLGHLSSAGLYPTFVIGESEDAKRAFYTEWTDEVADSIESNTFQGIVRGWHSFQVPSDFKKRAALLRLNYLDNDRFFKLVER